MINFKYRCRLLSIIVLVFSCFWGGALHAKTDDALVTLSKMRDPTTPLYQQPTANTTAGLNLTSIAKVGGKHFAIINGRKVFEGAEIDEAKIIKINSGGVVYSKNGVAHTLKLRFSIIE